MKKFVRYSKAAYLVIIGLFILFMAENQLLAQCDEKLVDKAIEKSGNDALFIREFKIKQSENNRKKKNKNAIPVARYEVRLNQGFVYRFNIENDVDNVSKALLQLKKDNLVLAATYNIEEQKDIQSFDYYCNESGMYQVNLSFFEGQQGCAVGVMSAVIQDSTTVASFTDSTGIENVLYAGVENYVDIAASDIRNGKLDVSISRGTIKNTGGLFLILVDEPGPLTVFVTARDSSGIITESFKSEFNVMNPILPTVSLMGSNGGLIKKMEILNSNPELSVNSWRNDLKFSIKSFTVTTNIVNEGSAITGTNRLSFRQIAIIKELKNGDTFYIKNIQVEDSNGRVYSLSPMGFIITEDIPDLKTPDLNDGRK